MSAPLPAVFLDRDGTMIQDPGHLRDLDGLQWYPWTIDAVRLLNRAGFLVFVMTNQGGIGLGLYGDAFVHEVHALMTDRLTHGGARVDGWFYCPHHPAAVVDALRVDCDCRKPRPGMVRQAQQRFAIDLARSFVVGDKMTDVGLAHAVGARAVLVRTGHGGEAIVPKDDGTVTRENLMDAVAWILSQHGHPKETAS